MLTKTEKVVFMSMSRYEVGKEYLFVRFVHGEAGGADSYSTNPDGDSCKSVQTKRLRAVSSYHLKDDDEKNIKCYSFQSVNDGANYVNEPVPLSGEKITIEQKNTVVKEELDVNNIEMDVAFVDARFVVEAYKDNAKVMGILKEIENRNGVKIGYDVDLDGKKIEGRPSKASEYSL